MNDPKLDRETLVERFREIKTRNGVPFLAASGGIFTPKTRKQLLGLKKTSGGRIGRSRADFWYDQRNRVERALIDLQLFIEVASKNNVSKVVTAETLEPIVTGLLRHPRLDQEKPDPLRAKIAQLFIKEGFDYLRYMQKDYLTKIHERSIEEAVDLSNHLALIIRSRDLE